MAKLTVADWDTSSANNTDIGGINITGAGNVSQGDNALRELMAQIKAGVPYLSGTSYVVTSTDAGASAGPAYELYRNSASPAAADALGEVLFTGKDSGGTTTTYASIRGGIFDPTDASEDGQLLFRLMDAGTLATRGLFEGQKFIVGDTASRTTQYGAATLQVKDAAAFARYNATAATAFQLGIARAQGTPAAPTIVANGDTLGYLQWEGYDSANFIRAASITVDVDGVPGLADMPGKMSFRTTSDGGSTPGTRMSLNAVGFLNVSSGSVGRAAPVTKTANFTVGDGENWLINNKSGSSCTVTLPDATLFPGREIMIKNLQAQTVVSATSNVVPLGTAVAGTAILSANAGRFCTLVSDGTNWVIMSGVV